MRVNSINPIGSQNTSNIKRPQSASHFNYINEGDNISFKGKLIYSKALLSIHEAYSHGVTLKADKCPKASEDFMAMCALRTIKAMEKLFGRGSLPKEVEFASMPKGIYGVYINEDKKVMYNVSEGCFADMQRLKLNCLSNYNFIAPNSTSTFHPAHIFVHELGHSAHWEHLKSRHGQEDAQKVWAGLVGTTVPNSIGRLITRYALGKYAVDSMDMCEFVAERIAKDVCDSFPDSTYDTFNDRMVLNWNPTKKVDIDYSTIYSRKHNYRYSSPQSYIDYFMQQVWNGDLEGAKKVARDAEEYLARLDSAKVPDSVVGTLNSITTGVNKVMDKLDKTLDKALPDDLGKDISKGVKAVAEGVGAVAGKVSGFFSKLSDKLDKKNDLKIKKWW